MTGIVVGAGRSPASRAAVRWAAAEAAVRRVRLTVVHAWPEPVHLRLDIAPGFDPLLPDGASCRVGGGDPAAGLLAEPADLVVLGGRTGASHPGPVVTDCLRASRRPLALVPTTTSDAPQRIVAALCGTPASLQALAWARQEATLRELPLTVVYAWQRQPGLRLHGAGSRQPVEDEAEGRLRAWAAAGTDLDLLGSTELLATRGAPLDTLLATVHADDLLVLGRPVSSRGPGRLVHGDVGADLAGLLPCPVVLVPATADASPGR